MSDPDTNMRDRRNPTGEPEEEDGEELDQLAPDTDADAAQSLRADDELSDDDDGMDDPDRGFKDP